MNNEAEIKAGIIRQCMDLGVYTAEQFLVDKNCMCKESGHCLKCPIGKSMAENCDVEYTLYIDSESCNDYIRNNPCKAVNVVRNYAIKGALPPIELKEVKHAYWQYHDAKNYYESWEECSNCGYIPEDSRGMLYCPKCGDMMDGDWEE